MNHALNWISFLGMKRELHRMWTEIKILILLRTIFPGINEIYLQSKYIIIVWHTICPTLKKNFTGYFVKNNSDLYLFVGRDNKFNIKIAAVNKGFRIMLIRTYEFMNLLGRGWELLEILGGESIEEGLDLAWYEWKRKHIQNNLRNKAL